MDRISKAASADATCTHTSAWGRIAERKHELDAYRQAVALHLAGCHALAHDTDLERLSCHVERCFDWGVSPTACSRTWVTRVEGCRQRPGARRRRGAQPS